MTTYRKELLRLALPAMVENILQMTMGLVDSYLVAQLSLVAVSGVSLANNILAIYQALFLALGASGLSLISKSMGQGNDQESQVQTWNLLVVTSLLGLLLALLSIFGGQSLLSLLGAESAVTETGGLYLALVGGGSPFLGLMIVLGNALRAQGQPKTAMKVSLFSNLLNALLSALAVYLLGWGIAGVALATVLSRLIGLALLWQAAGLSLKKANFERSSYKDLLALALPAAGERLMMRAGDVLMVALIVTMGTATVAGNAIGETISQFNYMAGVSMATATVSLVAYYQGRQDGQALSQVIKESYLLATGLMLAVSLSLYLFSDSLSGLFTSNPEAIVVSGLVLLTSLAGTFVTSGTLIYTAVWQGLGRSQLPFYATTLGMWIVRLGLAYVLVTVVKLGFISIGIATIMDNSWRFFYLRYRYQKTFLKK